MTFDPETLAKYPTDPGIYLMKDAKGTVLYVGKGKNLRARLKSYFSLSRDQREMVPYLTAQVETIDTIVTLSEKDALLLENQFIKEHKPKYNVLLKDDKSFISLVLTDHKWPMLRLVRFKDIASQKKGIIFGPYTSAYAARQIFDLVCKLFPLRQCSDVELASRVRPCLLYDIKRCIAPCVGKCTKEEYQSHIEKVTEFLKGGDIEVVSTLKKEMEKASLNLEFEKAQDLLQKIKQIEHVTTSQHIHYQDIIDADVIALYRQGDAIMIALLLLRNGKMVGSEHFSFHFIASSDAEIFETFLMQHYGTNKTHPKEVLLSVDLPNIHLLEEILPIKISSPKRGEKRALIEMGLKNAKALFVREQDAKSLKEKMLIELAETLQLAHFPKVIECFDTSNIAGTDPVASVVCFIDGEKEKKRTRLFKIRGQGDDYTAMREVLSRHFSKEKDKNSFCDLLIIDGGIGHLNLALDVFKELDIATVDVIALAKEDARHDKGLTQEKVFVPHQKEPILINPHSSLLFLLQRIRDEAHRQTIAFHKKKRAKRLFTSELDTIPGIGPIKKKRLLSHFGSIAKLKSAPLDEIKQVKGINQKDLDAIAKWRT